MPGRLGVLTAVLLTVSVPAVAVTTPPVPSMPETPVVSAQDPGYSLSYGTDSGLEQARLVEAEDRRITQVSSVAASAPPRVLPWARPYRLSTGGGSTLVLTARRKPYTTVDLRALAPTTFRKLGDRSYLLSENVVVLAGARLTLTQAGGLTLRLASSSQGFVSVVSLGGDLALAGNPRAPVRISSWNREAGAPDTDPSDGRAYIRAIGGRFAMHHVNASDLGFWSGRTGGISLTGTDRGPTAKAVRTRTPVRAKGTPAAPLVTPTVRLPAPGQSFLSARISDSRVQRNAFGLFISSAKGVQISDVTITRSLVDGLVLHHFASHAVLTRVSSASNARHGFAVARGAEQIQISDSRSQDNKGNGFLISGEPLAQGPSAAGQTVGGFGGNSVRATLVKNNLQVGVEIIGGVNVVLQDNRISDNLTDIVVRAAAQRVALTGNRINGTGLQGISVRDGARDVAISGNTINGARTAVYVRDSVANVQGNTITRATSHGVTVVGSTTGSKITHNSIAGRGPSAIDTARSVGVVAVSLNSDAAWQDTHALLAARIRSKASPATIIWILLGCLTLGSAVFSRRRARRDAGQRQPYAHPSTHGVSACAVGPDAGVHDRCGAAFPDRMAGAADRPDAR